MSGSVDQEATLASLHADGGEIIAIGSVMLSLAVAVVVLRLIAKSLSNKTFGLDDFMISIALIFYLATESLILRGRVVLANKGYC